MQNLVFWGSGGGDFAASVDGFSTPVAIRRGNGKETIMAEGKFDSNEMKDNIDHAHQDPSPSIIEEVKLPEIGIIFFFEEEVRTFYNSYATNVGFDISKLGEVQQLGAKSDEICSVLVEIMKTTKEKLIIAMENGQSRVEQLKEASTSGAKVIHSPLKVRTKDRPPTKRKRFKFEQIVNKSLAKARKKGVAGSDPNDLSEVAASKVAGLEEHEILLSC
ncbi:hypothetical protein ZIOFF_057148 [Zingiber officinale]|uniref:Uncharacterized protein n=1 Tax=Zingiber officinale TaxID=94328 RepID=A0A8J5FC28_ZINOF|nr:hypothetical protein ZIOFF_057148 [Zingiber officinale]